MIGREIELHFLAMFTRSLVTVVIFANSLLGHLCMMPMAYAASMPMQHDESMEMNMTPIVPMSPAHCEHCVHLDQKNDSPMDTGCAGHCFSKANDTVASVVSSSSLHLLVALPSSLPAIVIPIDANEPTIASTAPPFNFALTRSVVLVQ